MRSRAARVSSCVLVWATLGTSGFFLFQTEQHLRARGTALRIFEEQTRETATRIFDISTGQRAYVAAGQSAEIWWPIVGGQLPQLTDSLARLHGFATSEGARSGLLAASATVAEIAKVDRRARDYLNAGELLMAGDVVFTEGADAVASAVQHIEAARAEEQRVFDLEAGDLRRLEAYVLGGAAGVTALIVFALAVWGAGTPVRVPSDADAASESESNAAPSATPTVLSLREITRLEPPRPTIPSPDAAELAWNATADVCAECGRIQDLADLNQLLARAAGAIGARGLVVWLGSSSGADLRAVAAHGYSDQVLALMGPVHRAADNAAAAAYRTGVLQVVPARRGSSLGAVVAPLIGAEGCIGAFAAEIADDHEVSTTVQAQAAIIAAQLAGILHSAPRETRVSRTASA